ncbi:hypothetical protein FTO74_12445 [Granulicella sp. WH15]|nr:hypothetical protein FTO74_12445 [Granulicella sp. WH15]
MLLAAALLAPCGHAQERESSLSDKEVEKLRDAAYFPSERVLVFVSFLDERADAIQKLSNGPRKPGREEDLHDLYTQFSDILDELEDNLDDYGPHHRDLRKALPKLLKAAERWATTLRTPPENDAYTVPRRLALEALHDVREDASRLIEEQKSWFAQHPPSKDGDGRSEEPR